MNTDELRAAAKLVLSKPSVVSKYDDAANKLAQHAQRLYDETPVGEAYAESIAIEVSQGKHYYTIAERERDCVVLIRWSGGFHLKCGGFSVSERATRGDVRRLCEALGIELKEGE